MKYFLLIGFLSAFSAGFHRTAEINQLKEKAEQAYRINEYRKSSELYWKLVYDYGIKEENLRINLAHCFFKIDERTRAEKEYKALIVSENSSIRSIAYQQLGVLYGMRGKYKEAATYFMESLKTDPLNEKARYNYEMVKKIQDLQLQEEKSGKANQRDNRQKEKGKAGNLPGNNQLEMESKSIQHNGKVKKQGDIVEGDDNFRDESETETEMERKGKEDYGNGDTDGNDKRSDEEGKQSMEKKRARRLSQVNLNEEKARLILEAMKNEEIQYLQQMKKSISNKEYKNKPDW